MADLRYAARSLFWSNSNRSAPEWIGLQLFSRQGRTSTPRSDGIDDLETAPTLSRLKLAETRAISIFHSLARTSKRAAQIWNLRFPGWRGGLAGFVILASLVLVINLTGLLWAVTHLDDNPFATITIHSCDGASRLAAWSSFFINFFSTILLAGSNYCMQCLTSPTRAEVDAAHAASKSLCIGTLNWQNAFGYRKRRIGLLIALLLSSLPLLFIYNYAVMSQGALQSFFLYAWVTPGFINGAGLTISNELTPDYLVHDLEHVLNRTVDEIFHTIQNQTIDGQIWRAEIWEYMSATECMQKYKVLSSARGSLLLVTERFIDPSISSFTGSEGTGNLTESVLKYGIGGGFSDQCLNDWQYLSLEEWRRVIPGWRTVYCLAKKVPHRCRLQFHIWFLFVVVVLNAINLGCLLRTFWEQRDAPLITMGDAIASFLHRPCELTKGLCLLSESALTRHLRQEGDTLEDAGQARPKKFEAKVVRLYSSISYLSWLTYIILVMFALLAGAYFLNEIIIFYRYEIKPSLGLFWKLGFGKLHMSSIVLLGPEWCSRSWKCSQSFFPEIYNMFAGTLPQTVVAMAYILLNAHLTQIVQLQEWFGLEKRRQALRVTTPESNSEQTSTYWLSLPYQYSIPQILSSMMLSWVASQTVFFTRFKQYDEDGNYYNYPASNLYDSVSSKSPEELQRPPHTFRNGEWSMYFIGYSPLAVICCILFGILIFVVSLAIGLRKRVSGLPLGPSNSLVLAAACHPPDNDCYAARNQVQWGVINSRTRAREEPYHCTISSRKVEKPVKGRFYA